MDKINKMDKIFSVTSASLIHFITNGSPCYVKIKNINTGLYISIVNNNIIGSNCGSILLVKPCYETHKMMISIPEHIDEVTHEKLYEHNIIALSNNSIPRVGTCRNRDTYFCLCGNINEVCIRSCDDNLNMYGEIGRYMYMSDDGSVHVDGDANMRTSAWILERLNSNKEYIDVRSDYKTEHESLINDAKRGFSSLFTSINKYFTICNVATNKFLNISFGTCDLFHNIIGSNDKAKFIIRPVDNEKCVFISYYFNEKFVNIYTIPRTNDVYIGSPDCNWAKFYVVKNKNNYMFRCYCDETNNIGKYGKYLCMHSDDIVYFDGSNDEPNSLWNIKPE